MNTTEDGIAEVAGALVRRPTSSPGPGILSIYVDPLADTVSLRYAIESDDDEDLPSISSVQNPIPDVEFAGDFPEDEASHRRIEWRRICERSSSMSFPQCLPDLIL